MRGLTFLLILFVQLTCVGQKGYVLTFENEDFKKIKKHPQSKFKDSVSIVNYLHQFRELAFKKGYLMASFDTVKRDSMNKFSVRFFVGSKFSSGRFQLQAEEMKFVRKHASISEKMLLNVPLTPKEFQLTMSTIQSAYLSNGYPFVNVYVDEAKIDSTTLEGKIVVNRGPQMYWGDIHLRGDSTISKKFIANLVGIKKGQLYSEADFFAISQKLKRINFFEEIKPAELLFAPNGVELYVYLKNKPMSSANGIIGLQPNSVTGKMSLTGELNLKLHNILKRGELFSIDWRSIQPQTQSLRTRLSYPFLFNSNFGIDGAFDLYKRDSTFLEINATAGVNYYLPGGSYIKAFYESTTSNLLSGAANSVLTDLGSVRTNAYGISFFYNKVDYIPNPRRGFITEVKFSAGTRNAQVNDSTPAVKSTVYRGSIVLTGFIPLAKRHVIMLRSRTFLYSAPVIYGNEAYRFGGLTTQRGFNEEEIYGTSLTTLTFEYRFLADKNSFAFLFFDQSLYENLSGTYVKDQPFGFGAGFSFGTSIGVFSISYALGKQFDNPIMFRNGKIHFGYIAYF